MKTGLFVYAFLAFASVHTALGQNIQTGFDLPNVEMANLKFSDVTSLEFGAPPQLPANFDVDPKRLPPPILQDGPSCVAQAFAYGYLSFETKEVMSGEFLYRWCAMDKKVFSSNQSVSASAEGIFLNPFDALECLKTNGTCLAGLYKSWRQPYSKEASHDAKKRQPVLHQDLLTMQTLPRDEELEQRIKQHLLKHGRPVPFGMKVGREFLNIQFKGTYPQQAPAVYQKIESPMPGSSGNHMMLVTGWDDKHGFNVFNSFGGGFGNGGSIYISYAVFKNNVLIAFSSETQEEFGAIPDATLTRASFDRGEVEAYCKLGWRKDLTGQFYERLFKNISSEDISRGNLKPGQKLTAAYAINVRNAMPYRQEEGPVRGLILPQGVSVLQEGDQVEVIDYKAFQVNPPDVKGTVTHYWIKVRKVPKAD